MDSTDIVMPLSNFPDQPVYNIKAVCKRTGISAATLRAWERRHGMPSPNRARQGYRLYSDRDVAMLFWLQQQIQAGVNIGQASHQLALLLDKGHDPAIRIPAISASGTGFEFSRPRSPAVIQYDLVEAFTSLDDQSADNLLAEAVALYTTETALITILQRAAHIVQEQELPGAVKRFALNYARQYLLNLIQITPVAKHRRGMIAIGFSDEKNEIDLLILSLLLRRQSWPVTYLGSDLEPHLLGTALADAPAAVILFYTDDPRNAAKLKVLTSPDSAMGHKAHVVYCGRAELEPTLAAQIPFDYLGSDLRHIVQSVAALLAQG
ncbi:MAG: MerR family transcriptional regulator [Anaerolineae bacterium]|nr:MerR family transcriptional regulator [Anaerolineae bacterium]